MKRLIDWLRPKPKFCVDCAWHKFDQGHHRCYRRKYQSKVTGEIKTLTRYCDDERDSDGDLNCGVSGRSFKPKE